MAQRLSPEALRYARAVAQTGSFSAAARAYGVTQPALSNGIAKLEAYLGGRLFERSSRGVSPTAFGAAVLPLIERALSCLDTIDVEAARWRPSVGESIRMGVSPLVNPRLVARAYGAVRTLPALAASRQLILSEANLADLRESLTAGRLDIVVIPSVAPMPRYEHRVVDSEPIVLVEEDPPTAAAAELGELAGKQLILMPDTCGLTTFTEDLLREHDLAFRAYPGEASTYQVLEEWSNLGLGAAILPVSKLTRPGTRHRAVLDEDGTTVEIFYEAVWDPASPLVADLRTLADGLTDPARGAPGP